MTGMESLAAQAVSGLAVPIFQILWGGSGKLLVTSTIEIVSLRPVARRLIAAIFAALVMSQWQTLMIPKFSNLFITGFIVKQTNKRRQAINAGKRQKNEKIAK
ncbi:hypothetical protein [Nostoc sp.]|uniref:hypothetical protein n=1 Tax=Nostoc sp. TaxID=1180 RepID=UPI002FFBC935